MKSNRLFIYCAGGQGRETLQAALAIHQQAPRWSEILFVDDALEAENIAGYPVLTFTQYLEEHRQEGDRFAVANGEPVRRRRIAEALQRAGLFLETLVYPRFFLPSSVDLAEGAFVAEGVTLSDHVRVGYCASLNANATVGHDAVMGDFVTVSPGAIISGNVTIGEGTYIGTGAVIRDEVSIGKNCIIGMGSLVTKDIPDNVVAYGSPCKVIRENTDGIVFQ